VIWWICPVLGWIYLVFGEYMVDMSGVGGMGSKN